MGMVRCYGVGKHPCLERSVAGPRPAPMAAYRPGGDRPVPADTSCGYLAFPSRMKLRRHTLSALLFFVVFATHAQLGGQTSFRVLDIPSSARSSALGGNYIAVQDNDINLGIFNPSLLNSEMSRQV